MEDKKLAKKLISEQEIPESYFTALCWLEPDKYNFYGEDKINEKHFLNNKWRFYFSVGKHLSDQGVQRFDDVSVYKAIKEMNADKQFDQYGGFATINEIMEEVRGSEDNDESYYLQVKKGFTLKELTLLFGDKVLQDTNKYNYHKEHIDKIVTYWSDKLNSISMGTDNRFDAYNLFDNMEKYIEKVESDTMKGMPYYKSPQYTKMTNGWSKGHLYMFGAFGNAGKTSFLFSKVIMACIKAKEKLVVIANEEDIDSFTEKLYVSVLGSELHQAFDRKKFKQSGFTDEDKGKIKEAQEWVKDISEGDNALIKFIFMEEYIMDDVKKVVKHYHSRGYENIIVDTHKVSERSKNDQRWVTFVEDTKSIYKLCRPNGGGLNLRMWLNFQLADHSVSSRYLDFSAIGEGKAAKNEASVVNMIRAIWESEFEGGKKKIFGFKFIKENGKFIKKTFMLKKEDLGGSEAYYLLFQPKSRFSGNNDNGQPVLILKVNFNFNTWDEVGFCNISNDRMR